MDKKEKRERVLISIAAAVIAIAVCGSYYAWARVYNFINNKMEAIEIKIDEISNKFVEMGAVDTLVLTMSEYNAKNVEVLEEHNTVFNERLTAAENDIRRIDADLDAYD